MGNRKEQERERKRAHTLDRFLEKFLQGGEITEADLDELRSLKVLEDQRLEYKEAAWAPEDDRRDLGVGHPRSLTGRIAKYVSGFANGIGGVLVLGIKEERAEDNDGRKFVKRLHLDALGEACSRDSIVDAVRAGLARLAGQLPRSARFQVVPAMPSDEGEDRFYLVVGTGRAQRMVPCVEKEQFVYYFRLHDSTVHAPDYLVSDLFLGHRQHPISRIWRPYAKFEKSNRGPLFRISMHVENAGLSWLVNPRCGLIHYPGSQIETVPSEVAAELMMVPCHLSDRPTISNCPFSYPKGEKEQIPPFERRWVTVRPDMRGFLSGHTLFVWAAALYVVGFNQEPEWFQVVVFRDHEQLETVVLPCPDRKPIVAFHTCVVRWEPELKWATWDAGFKNFTLLDEPEDKDGGE